LYSYVVNISIFLIIVDIAKIQQVREVKTAFFLFVSLSIIFCFASFRFHFFVSLQNGHRLDKLKDNVNIFLYFFTDFPRFSLYPFSLCRIRFFFISFSLHLNYVSLQISTFRIDAIQAKKAFFRIEAKKNSLPFRFISLQSENERRALSLIKFFFYLNFWTSRARDAHYIDLYIE
jgi:hypothetical protein